MNHKINHLGGLILLVTLLCGSKAAQGKISVGAELGGGFPLWTHGEFLKDFDGGANADYFLDDDYSLGVYFNFEKMDTPTLDHSGGALSAVKLYTQGVVFEYYVIPGFYLGANLGFTIASHEFWDSDTTKTTYKNKTYMALGSQLGYDLAIMDSFSVGAQARYIQLFGGNMGLIQTNLRMKVLF